MGPIGTLTPYARNARVHSKKQVHQIAASIREFGFINPIFVDEAKTIIAGHGRYEAAKVLGLAEVPSVRLDLPSAKARSFAIADNKIALNSTWDLDNLKLELADLGALELDFDLEITGFATAEIDDVLDGGTKPVKEDPADQVPEAERSRVTRLGDVWELGPHRLVCGDALKSEAFKRLMGDDRARLVFVDPPFSVRINGHVGGAGSVKQSSPWRRAR